MDKKGDSKLLSIWMFLNWFIIAFFIVVFVGFFYSSNVDVRAAEADTILKRVEACAFPDNKLGVFKIDTLTDETDFVKFRKEKTSEEQSGKNLGEQDKKLENLPNLFKECFLNENILNSRQYLVSFGIYEKLEFMKKLSSIDKEAVQLSPIAIIEIGNSDFKNVQCVISGKNFPKCRKEFFIVTDSNKNEFVVEITTGASKKLKNT